MSNQEIRIKEMETIAILFEFLNGEMENSIVFEKFKKIMKYFQN